MTPIEERMPIAEYHVIWVFRSGERRPGRIAICAPEPDPSLDVENDTTWACWWFAEGLDNPRRALGNGSLQPLMLALEMIGSEIHMFISRGGKVIAPEEPGSAGVLMILRLLMRRLGDPPPTDPVLAEIDAEFARSDEEQ